MLQSLPAAPTPGFATVDRLDGKVHPAPNTFGKLINEKSAKTFKDELDEEFDDHGTGSSHTERSLKRR